MAAVTIGFIPRERFSVAGKALQRIFDCTGMPFNLIVVDCNIPEKYRQQMDEVLKGRNNVMTIRTAHHLLPNQSRNLVIREATSDFICLVENDVLVENGWLARLIQACAIQGEIPIYSSTVGTRYCGLLRPTAERTVDAGRKIQTTYRRCTAHLSIEPGYGSLCGLQQQARQYGRTFETRLLATRDDSYYIDEPDRIYKAELFL